MNGVKNSVALMLLSLCCASASRAETTVSPLRKVSIRNVTPSENSNVRGADWVLSRISRPADWGPEEETKNAKLAAFERDVQSFSKQSAILSAAQAAPKWLDLALRFQTLAKLKATQDVAGYDYGFEKLLEVLPSPRAWSELRRLIEARQKSLKTPTAFDGVLLVLGRVLNGSEDEQWSAAEILRRMVAAPQTKTDIEYSMSVSDVGGVVTALQNVTTQRRNIERGFGLQLSPGGHSEWEDVSLPRAFDSMNDADASRLVERALISSRVGLSTRSSSPRIQKLARELALKNVRKMAYPQWSLAQSVEGLALYRALEKRFAKPSAFWITGGRDLARQFALLALLKKGDVKTAQSLIARSRGLKAPASFEFLNESSMYGESWQPFKSADEEIRSWLSQPANRAVATKLYDVLKPQLLKRPDTPFWELFETVASLTGRRSSLVAVYQSLSNRADVSASSKANMRDRASYLLLSLGRTEEGVAQLRRNIADKNNYNRGQAILRLARVAAVANRRDWMDEAVSLFRIHADKDINASSSRDEFVRVLIGARRWSDAEAFAFDNLSDASQTMPAEITRAVAADGKIVETTEEQQARRHASTRRRQISSARTSAQSSLISLAEVYSRVGRHDDVLALLERAPFWNASDLSQNLMATNNSVTNAYDAPLGALAARALVARNRGDDRARAVCIARAVLRQNANIDGAYEILLAVEGRNVLPFLDQLARENRFEERPLIWKAELLRQAGSLPAAERVARAAIAIDPSDGEQGVGNRLRVYGVLANILTARGKARDAQVLHGAVNAVRLSEQADALHNAGLTDAALALYGRSLGYFADAYCIQSRLAIQLADAGRLGEAATHYRRAYELMPTSFGRTESHCFGCEGTFNGSQAQGIAERVFSRLIAQSPRNPQLHYLMGHVREQQGRYNDALASFRQAVRLDRDYLNAWSKIQSVSLTAQRPIAEVEAATLQLRRLAPKGDHSSTYGYDIAVRDLRGLWNQVAKTTSSKPKETPPLLPLTNSVKPDIEYSKFSYDSTKPGQALANTQVLRALSSFVQSDFQNFWNNQENLARNRESRPETVVVQPQVVSETTTVVEKVD